MLTAGHNLNPNPRAQDFRFFPADVDGISYAGAEIRLHPNYAAQTNYDLALVKLGAALPDRYSERLPWIDTWGEPAHVAEPLVDQGAATVRWLIMGYGFNKPLASGGTFGVLRWGYAKPDGLVRAKVPDAPDNQKNMFWIEPGIKKHLILTHDSGGPLLYPYACHPDLIAGLAIGENYGKVKQPNAVYARLWDSRDWLNQNINALCGADVVPPSRGGGAQGAVQTGSDGQFVDPNVCDDCAAASCGDECDYIPDHCGDYLGCGSCPSAPSPRCGDGLCNGDELCLDCPEDCGLCFQPSCPEATSGRGEACFIVDDGCGQPLFCGACPSSGCIAASCEDRSGTIYDGCDGIRYCGGGDKTDGGIGTTGD